MGEDQRLDPFYTHPETLVTRCVPIALTPPTGAAAVKLCNTCMCDLESVGTDFENFSGL